MITTRERLTVGEIASGLIPALRTNLDALLRPFVPFDGHQVVYVSQGKAAFEQIAIAANLRGRRLLVPAFFPDDFVGIFLKYGITPVFVDVDPRTYHLDLNTVSPAQLEGCKALLVEHTFGLPGDGAAYRAFCDRHELLLIEDCARALGALSGDRLVGDFGHYAMFSLPKCAPVRAGGLAVAEVAFRPHLLPARLGFTGVLHALTLIRYPFASALEGAVYAMLADSPVYPREVGNYDPLPARELDALARLMLKIFLPLYRDALQTKHACAVVLRRELEPAGFRFQSDPRGEHTYTSISVEPPEGCDADQLKAFLIANRVKASAMWRNAIGVSEFGRKTWSANPESTPVARRLSTTLIQLPVSRFRTRVESARIAELCMRFAADHGTPAPRVARLATARP